VWNTVISTRGCATALSRFYRPTLYITGTTVMLKSLDFSEVFAFSAFETVVTVKLEKSSVDCDIGIRCFSGSISIAIVINSGRVVMNSPYKFFYRVVEAEFVLSACSTD
jgi:hypothetical protein